MIVLFRKKEAAPVRGCETGWGRLSARGLGPLKLEQHPGYRPAFKFDMQAQDICVAHYDTRFGEPYLNH